MTVQNPLAKLYIRPMARNLSKEIILFKHLQAAGHRDESLSQDLSNPPFVDRSGIDTHIPYQQLLALFLMLAPAEFMRH